MLSLILLVFAFVLAVVAGIVSPITDPWRWSLRLLCWAFACFFLAQILTIAPALHLSH